MWISWYFWVLIDPCWSMRVLGILGYCCRLCIGAFVCLCVPLCAFVCLCVSLCVFECLWLPFVLGFWRYQAEIFYVDSYQPKEGFKLYCRKIGAKNIFTCFLFHVFSHCFSKLLQIVFQNTYHLFVLKPNLDSLQVFSAPWRYWSYARYHLQCIQTL